MAPMCRELNWELGILENLTSLGTRLLWAVGPRHIHVGNSVKTAKVFLMVFSRAALKC